MKNSFESLISTSHNEVKYWWITMLVGVVIFAMGVVVFAYPAESYLGMAVAFGWLILLSGLSQIILYFTNRHVVTNRGWVLFGGIIESALGLILIFSFAFSATALPMFLGFWLLFRSFSMIGLVSDMRQMRVVGNGWTIFTAILLMIASIMILVQPAIFGVQAVVIWVEVSLWVAGVSVILFSLQLRKAHQVFEK